MRRVWWIACALALMAVAGSGAVVLALPDGRTSAGAVTETPDAERAALLAELRPPKRARPVIAVFANNSGTETTDFIVPFGVLRASDSADVVAVALRDEPVAMMPALRIRPELDTAKFDATHPEGADFVIVPALHDSDDPAALAWLAAQARSGATMIGICEGGWVLGAAGLLDGRNATTHWFSVTRFRERFPGMTWVADRRYVADRGVVTTTGVSASIPVSLTLVEAIAGRARAEALARELGVPSFGAGHASAAFALDRGSLWTLVWNSVAFWSHDSLDVPVEPGVDEVALALTADAWARTYKNSVRAVASSGEVVSRHGLTLLVDAPAAGAEPISLAPTGTSALDTALAEIERRYGRDTADLVALQLEYAPAH